MLSPASAVPGLFRLEKTPYFDEIAESAANPVYNKIVIAMGSQMGKTEFLFNLIGQRLDDDPAPTLFVGSTQKLVESISKSRIMKMFKTSESLWRKLSKGKDNKVAEKFVAGVQSCLSLADTWPSCKEIHCSCPVTQVRSKSIEIVTIKELSEKIKVNERTLYMWAELGQIPCLKMNSAVRFDMADVKEWLKGCKKKPHSVYNPHTQARSS